ncbi:helix-turn-helix domain-containing protein [Aquiflexum sp.]|uniref:helix-turn-helix domain-containing protein n=1 Tax=Aquiflexum sp. TaxID=1872584 RepID=UPI003594663B
MQKTLEIKSVTQTHKLLGLAAPKHPLVTVIDAQAYEGQPVFKEIKVVMDMYRITLKSSNYKGYIKYGRNSYDYEEGTLIFSAPGQVMEYGSETEPEPVDAIKGWTLAFHPDLIRKHPLSKKISQYSFFNYDVTEALHLSDNERRIIEELIEKVVVEYSQNLDQHSQHLIISNIELLLDYCLRFYDRQFYTRTNFNSDIVSKFEKLLISHYQSDSLKEHGMPTVGYFGKAMNVSPHYLSDLLKKETGMTAKEQIHLFIINKAKNSLLNSAKSISEIGYELGFEYPQHFSNLFKSKTGYSPSEFRNHN